jgi:hypothetical protein
VAAGAAVPCAPILPDAHTPRGEVWGYGSVGGGGERQVRHSKFEAGSNDRKGVIGNKAMGPGINRRHSVPIIALSDLGFRNSSFESFA